MWRVTGSPVTQAEKANGRAAMVGYFLAYFVDSWTGAGLYDQQNSFLGKLALHLVVFAILIFRCSTNACMLSRTFSFHSSTRMYATMHFWHL